MPYVFGGMDRIPGKHTMQGCVFGHRELTERISFKLSAEVYPPTAFQHKNLAGTPD